MKKIKYSNFFLLGIFIYIIFHIISFIASKTIQTQVLENEDNKMKISRKCIIVRDEYLLKSDINGTLNLLVDEGSRVSKSQEVASIYNNVDSDIDEKINALDEEIDKIKAGEINISKNEINNFNENIELIVSKIQNDLLEEDYSNIKEYKETLSNYVNDKNKLLNNGIDTAKLSAKEDEKEILENQKNNNVFTCLSSIAGIVSYKYDGNEEKYTFTNLDSITKSDIQKEVDNYKEIKTNSKEVKSGDIIARVINNYDAYVATYIDENEVSYFEENQSIVLCNNDEEIDAKVYKINKENDNYIAIFKINNQNMGIYDTRVKEFDIIYKQIEGLKIPKSAIKTVDNKEGVYVINEEDKTPNFIELKGIIYEDDDYKYVDYYKNKIDGVSTVDLYDKIILKPNIININMKIE
ncbi:HlyD family efflux transporter periplasmic adaptor subunit [Romboutsia sp. 1001713B170207_170306_H8]|uniref:HlyD family efflux transporter periplasmic adaptor subunit n=1 Tax=Romboutsia sp. 1001713B170207_170306_H8 TaxID=2787112 RepID=UPI0008202EA4|nr:HlyD family efflux transporter periplasmic adaptor subunit [Romboutsia sp. 1001713B170207_170306_H8]SCH14741.1 putative membrane fusion protein [uncultured Clostridium sp.]